MIAVPLCESPGVTLWTPIEFEARTGPAAARATLMRLRIFACPQAAPEPRYHSNDDAPVVACRDRVTLYCTSTATRASPGVRLSVPLEAVEPGSAGLVMEVDVHTTLWIASPSVAIAAWTVLDAAPLPHVAAEPPAVGRAAVVGLPGPSSATVDASGAAPRAP